MSTITYSKSKPWLLPSVISVLSLPFLVGSAEFAWSLMHTASTAVPFMAAQLLGAALFSFGFFIGIVGSSISLTATSDSTKRLGTATTLFGCAHIILSFIIRNIIREVMWAKFPSLLPIVFPVALWIFSIWLSLSSTKPKKDTQTATEELPQ